MPNLGLSIMIYSIKIISEAFLNFFQTINSFRSNVFQNKVWLWTINTIKGLKIGKIIKKNSKIMDEGNWKK